MAGQKRDRVRWLLVAFISVSVLMSSSIGDAANTGSLAGVARDQDGEPLPGVTVQISSEFLIGGPQVALTGGDGRFAFHLLPVGVYTAEATLSGFLPAVGDVRVQANRVGSVAFELVPEAFTGEIEVTAQVPVVDTSQVNTGVVFDEEYLQLTAIGADGRDYLRALRQAPGVTLGGNSNPIVFGSTSGENSYLIDDMNTSDPSSGTFGRLVNFDSIQELNFQTGGFEAEFGQATGGIVNLVTKSGGNRFSGSFDARYRSQKMIENGEHFDRDELTSSLQQYSATLGGPLLRDRLWFFGSLQYTEDVSQDTFAHFPSSSTSWQFMGKLTWQASMNHRAIFRYSTDPAEFPGINSHRLVLESARATQEQGGELWALELNSVLSASWLLVAQIGTNSLFARGFPTDNPNTLSGHRNEDTGLDYANYGFCRDLPRTRDEARLDATWMVDDLAGSHEFKAGVDYSRVRHGFSDYFTGGGFVIDHNPSAVGWDPIDLNGDGYFNHYLQILEPEDAALQEVTSTATIASAFLQDAWRPHPRITVKPGIRLDNVQPTNHAGERIADMDRWQPRLGFAWDVAGNARHVLRAAAGRFMDPTSLNIPAFASGIEGVATHEYDTLEYYCNRTFGVVCTIDDVPAHWNPRPWTNWAGQEYVLIDSRGIEWPATAITLDQAGLGRLQAPYSDQLILAYEAQVAPDTSIELSRVHKVSESLIEDTCSGNEWAYDPGVPFPSLEDPATWTRAADCQGDWLIVNMPGHERRYDAWMLRGETRKRWGHLTASYTYSDSRGSGEAGPRLYFFYDADHFPLEFYNRFGKLSDHRDHRINFNGYLLLPERFTVGINSFWSSPGHQTLVSTCGNFIDAPASRSTQDQMTALGIDPATMEYCSTGDGAFLASSWIYHSPRGALSMKSVWQVNMQLSKGFKVGATDLTAILTVYNLFGHEWDQTFNHRAFLQDTDEDGNGLNYQDDDPNAPYYDEYYGEDSSPVLVPVGEATSYWAPRRYEIGFRIEF